jgi:hypothetical protein
VIDAEGKRRRRRGRETETEGRWREEKRRDGERVTDDV